MQSSSARTDPAEAAVAGVLQHLSDPWSAPDAAARAIRAALEVRATSQASKCCLAAIGRLLLPSLLKRLREADSIEDPAFVTVLGCAPKAIAVARCSGDATLVAIGEVVDAKVSSWLVANALRTDVGAVLQALNAIDPERMRPPRAQFREGLRRMARRVTDTRPSRRVDLLNDSLEDARCLRLDPSIGANRAGAQPSSES